MRPGLGQRCVVIVAAASCVVIILWTRLSEFQISLSHLELTNHHQITSNIMKANATTCIFELPTPVQFDKEIVANTSWRHTQQSLASSDTSTECTTVTNQNFIPLQREDIKDLKTFILFIGYARSGHSIVGSLLDAHPDIVLAHEYNVLQKIETDVHHQTDFFSLFNKLYKNTYNNALQGWRSAGSTEKGYNLSVKCSWQGRFRKLKVIGDKAAGKTIEQFKINPEKCTHLKVLLKAQNITLKAIQVFRNPYDIIATRVLYSDYGKKSASSKNVAQLKRQVKRLFTLAHFVNRLRTECNLSVLDVHLSDLVRRPHRVLLALCEHLGVECSHDYLEKCETKVFKSLSKTRFLVEWTQDLIKIVAQNIKSFKEFSGYSFTSDC